MRVGLLPVAVVDLMSLLLAPVTRPQQIESGDAMDIRSRLELFVDDYLIESLTGVKLELHSREALSALDRTLSQRVFRQRFD